MKGCSSVMAPRRKPRRSAGAPSGPAVGSSTAVSIHDVGSSSALKAAEPGRSARGVTSSGVAGGSGQAAAASLFTRSASSKTKMGFEITHGTGQPGTRTSAR